MNLKTNNVKRAFFVVGLISSFQYLLTACGDSDSSDLSNSVNVANFIDSKGNLTPSYEKVLREKYASQPRMIKLIEATQSLVGTAYSEMDCSKFAKTVYEKAGLKFSEGKSQIATSDLATGSLILNAFQRFDVASLSSFKPNPSDLLGWPQGANGASNGHVVVVIDPENCVIAHSTSWMWDNGAKESSKVKGVAFNKIESSYCVKADKKSWWKLNNKDSSSWTFHLQHKQ